MLYTSQKVNNVNLLRLLEDLTVKIKFKNGKDFDENLISDSLLNKLISEDKNVIRGRQSNLFRILDIIPTDVIKYINDELGATVLTNFIHYPTGGYMNWHTNSDFPGERIYLAYSESGHSYFKYFDKDTNKIVEVKDNVGWSINRFMIPKLPEKFWHCVYSKTNRISIGFRVIK